jgi:NitT/TauT family transport system substrate-binding protein
LIAAVMATAAGYSLAEEERHEKSLVLHFLAAFLCRGKSKNATCTSRSAARSPCHYLPLTITERLGYFKDEGLNVRISDFAGGTRSLEAVVGGSADVVSGSYEHTINMQSKKISFQGFVLAGASPQISIGIATAKAANYKGPKDLKGLKVGVSAPGSSTNMVVNYFIAGGGLKPSDVSIIGIGAGANVIAAVDQGRVDVISQTDPAVTILEKEGKIRVIAETRTPEGTEKLFGGPMPAASLYAPIEFIKERTRCRR